jgi:hypothetical protein
MSKFDDFFGAVKTGLGPLVSDFAAQAKAQVLTGMKDYLQARAGDLKSWTEDLAAGRMTKLEFEDLVTGLKSEIEMRALAVAGVQTARLQRLRDAFVNLILDKAFAVFLP